MTMVITEITIPIMAVLGLQWLLFRENSRQLLKADFRKIIYAFTGMVGLLILMYLMMDYKAPFDDLVLANKWDNSGTDEIGRLIVSGLKADRQSMFGGQLLRTIAFALVVLGILYLYVRDKLKPIAVAITLLVISTIELLMVDNHYFNSDNFVSPDEMANNNFTPSPIDQQILNDKDPNFRVLNMTGNPFTESKTSYFHKSVGGYHPAKLRIYQDLIEKYFRSSPNFNILDMLNTKYVIMGDPKTGQPNLLPNPSAYGPCWLVKNVKLTNGPVESIQLLGNTDLKDTAIVDKAFAAFVIQPQYDSTSSIKMTKFDNDAIEYEANCNGPQFAVFSEIYYPKGWNAYIDGKKTNYSNADYVLRGLSIPTGKHAVRFVFEPASYKKWAPISFIASIFILLLFLGGLFMAWRATRIKVVGAS